MPEHEASRSRMMVAVANIARILAFIVGLLSLGSLHTKDAELRVVVPSSDGNTEPAMAVGSLTLGMILAEFLPH